MLMNFTIAGKFVATDKQKIRKFLKLAYTNNLDRKPHRNQHHGGCMAMEHQ